MTAGHLSKVLWACGALGHEAEELFRHSVPVGGWARAPRGRVAWNSAGVCRGRGGVGVCAAGEGVCLALVPGVRNMLPSACLPSSGPLEAACRDVKAFAFNLEPVARRRLQLPHPACT